MNIHGHVRKLTRTNRRIVRFIQMKAQGSHYSINLPNLLVIDSDTLFVCHLESPVPGNHEGFPVGAITSDAAIF